MCVFCSSWRSFSKSSTDSSTSCPFGPTPSFIYGLVWSAALFVRNTFFALIKQVHINICFLFLVDSNVFLVTRERVDPEVRDFALGVVSMAYDIGRTAAAGLGLGIQRGFESYHA